MFTTNEPFRKTAKRKLDPNTLVKFPLSFKEKCGTCTDVRIGCSICSRGDALGMDVYPWLISDEERLKDRDNSTEFQPENAIDYYCDNFTPLCDIDIRIPYHSGPYRKKDNIQSRETFYGKTYYVFKNPPIEYVHNLRNMLHKLFENGVNTYCSGVGNFPDSDEDLTDYYGKGDQEPINPNIFWEYNFIDKDEISLCKGCFLWSSFVYPEYVEFFEEKETKELAYLQWLNEHEDELIVKPTHLHDFLATEDESV